eukprot:PhM_4_TR9476/c0_g1_i1/m.67123/K15341/DCLRE1B, SNM1B; DNA cross-link repair 1B protein
MRIPYSPIAFDNFNFQEGVTTYLLTHIHTDHLVGLCTSWNYGVVVCHPITKALLLNRIPQFDPKRIVALSTAACGITSNIVPLPGGVRSLTRKHTDDEKLWHIEAIDANHIPGAVMFRLYSPNGETILVTGDFRLNAQVHLSAIPAMSVDHLFLDDTWLFNDTEMLVRDDVVPHILSLLRGISGRYVLVISLHNHFGKEDVVAELASILHVKAQLSETRYKVLQIVAEHDPTYPIQYFVPSTSTTETNTPTHGEAALYAHAQRCQGILVAESNDDVRIDSLRRRTVESGVFHLGLVMTGLPSFYRSNGATTWRHDIAYSLHSTRKELVDFVAHVRPKSITSAMGSVEKSSAILSVFGDVLRTPNVNATILSTQDHHGDTDRVEDVFRDDKSIKSRKRTMSRDTYKDRSYPASGYHHQKRLFGVVISSSNIPLSDDE